MATPPAKITNGATDSTTTHAGCRLPIRCTITRKSRAAAATANHHTTLTGCGQPSGSTRSVQSGAGEFAYSPPTTSAAIAVNTNTAQPKAPSPVRAVARSRSLVTIVTPRATEPADPVPPFRPGCSTLSSTAENCMFRRRRAGSPTRRPPLLVDTDLPDSVIFYWRPGCGFCAALRRRLRRAGLPVVEINIWDDRAAATFVRSVARGNETVPTVVVGRRALVNPAAAEVLAAVRAEAPHLLMNVSLQTRTPRRRCRWRARPG